MKTSDLVKAGFKWKQVKCWTLVCSKCGENFDYGDGYILHEHSKVDFLEHLDDAFYDELPQCPCQKVKL